jgi:hypothetical protein
MTRCALSPLYASPLRATRRALLALAALALAAPVLAQSASRPFPPEAWRGQLQIAQPPLVSMDDRPVMLSPGARILDTSNRVVLSASLVGRTHTVNYLLNPQGQITQVWLLTEAEAREKRRTMGVERNYRFASQEEAAAPGAAPAGPVR